MSCQCLLPAELISVQVSPPTNKVKMAEVFPAAKRMEPSLESARLVYVVTSLDRLLMMVYHSEPHNMLILGLNAPAVIPMRS